MSLTDGHASGYHACQPASGATRFPAFGQARGRVCDGRQSCNGERLCACLCFYHLTLLGTGFPCHLSSALSLSLSHVRSLSYILRLTFTKPPPWRTIRVPTTFGRSTMRILMTLGTFLPSRARCVRWDTMRIFFDRIQPSTIVTFSLCDSFLIISNPRCWT